MNLDRWFLQERLVFGVVTILCLTGVFAWFTVNEQEDPFFPYRNGFIAIEAPGVAAEILESSVIKPLERVLSAVDEVAAVSIDIADGAAGIDIELQENIYDTDSAWQRVRDRTNNIRSQFDHLISVFALNDRAQDTAGILLSIKSERNLLDIRRFALLARDELYKMPMIREIEPIGDPGEKIEILYPQQTMLETGIAPTDIAEQVAAANGLTAVGVLKGEAFQSNIQSITRLKSLETLKNIEVRSRSGTVYPLTNIADLRTVADPLRQESFWVNGKQTIGLSIIVPPNQLRITDFGDLLKKNIKALNQKHPDFTLETVFFQPEWTEKRRDDLTLSLLYSSIGVGVVLFLLMSARVAVIVSLTIPAIVLSSIALYSMFGGVLQQMSIAGLVISLGLMVDNSIVMAELIARYRSTGRTKIDAIKTAIATLYRPLATSTFTTIAAFLPMLLAEGNVADFIRMIPVIVITAITISYLYALALVPTLSNNIDARGRPGQWLDKIGAKVSVIGTRYPNTAGAGFMLVFIAAVVLSNDGHGEFFPKTSRNQAFIDVEGSYGQSHAATLAAVRQVEEILRQSDKISRVVSFVGNSGPRFYYNLSESPNEPNIGRVVFETYDATAVPGLVEQLNLTFEQRFKGVRVRASEIGQGPPIESPIEIRVLGDNRRTLLAAAEEIYAAVDNHAGTADVRRAYIIGKPQVSLAVDEVQLFKTGFTKSDLSSYIAWRTTGLAVTDIPAERESLEVVLIDNNALEHPGSNYIENTILLDANSGFIPFTLLATKKIEGAPPFLTRRNGFRSLIVKADVEGNTDEEAVLEELMAGFSAIAQRYGVSLEFGGEAEDEEDSGAALVKTLPIGIVLLFSALILQFNSIRLSGLVMITIPLAMLGVSPALSLAGVNFGFMSTLGLLALTGIVVNTAIILIDRVLIKIHRDNLPVARAVEDAVKERFRPVVLTAATTIVGMIPLTSPESPLWPPLAWTIIGGLMTSTLFTLILLPGFLRIILGFKNLGFKNGSYSRR